MKFFIFHNEWLSILENVSPTVKSEVIEAVATYVGTGEKPCLRSMARLVFMILKPQIDADIQRISDNLDEDGKRNGDAKNTDVLDLAEPKKTFSEDNKTQHDFVRKKEKEKRKVSSKEIKNKEKKETEKENTQNKTSFIFRDKEKENGSRQNVENGSRPNMEKGDSLPEEKENDLRPKEKEIGSLPEEKETGSPRKEKEGGPCLGDGETLPSPQASGGVDAGTLDHDGKAEGETKAKSSGRSRDKASIMAGKVADCARRKKAFVEEVMAYKGDYDEGMLRDFISYWTERNKSTTKMRYELEVTWELSMRLAYWERRTAALRGRARDKPDLVLRDNSTTKYENDDQRWLR